MPVRRANLMHRIQATESTHAGLWLDKFIRLTDSDDNKRKEAQGELVKEVCAHTVPAVYNSFFQRWQGSLQERGAVLHEATLADSRLAIGLGSASVLETSITLHHTYGVPYIPGSALKGLAAAYARQRLTGTEWRKHGAAYRALFGFAEDQEAAESPVQAPSAAAGYVTFYDALWIPGSAELQPDVLTIHHQEYYNTDANHAPTDWDKTIIVPFLSATGKFLLALASPAGWGDGVELAYQILALALRDIGIGAKTSSGYGRMTIADVAVPYHDGEATAVPQASAEQSAVDAQITALKQLSEQQVAPQIFGFVEQWRALESPYREQLGLAILQKIETLKAKQQRQRKEKTWYQEVLTATPDFQA